MSATIRASQVWSLAALALLMVIVPWPLRGSGIPPTRTLEMAPIWVAYGMLLLGMGMLRANVSLTGFEPQFAKRLRAGLNLSSGAVFITALVCLVWVANTLATTLNGVHLVRLPFEVFLYPTQLNYALSLPLLFAIVCHASILLMQIPPFAAPAPPAPSPLGRVFLLSLLGLTLTVYLLTALGALVDRWFAVGSVSFTWVACWIFLALATEQLGWSATLPAPPEGPFAPAERAGS